MNKPMKIKMNDVFDPVEYIVSINDREKIFRPECKKLIGKYILDTIEKMGIDEPYVEILAITSDHKKILDTVVVFY